MRVSNCFYNVIACMIEEQGHNIQALPIPELQPFVFVCQIHLSGIMFLPGAYSSLSLKHQYPRQVPLTLNSY